MGTGRGWAACFLFLTLPGCAVLPPRPGFHSPHLEAELSAPADQVWEAVQAVLAGAPRRATDRERGIVRTDWIEGWGDRPFGLFGGSWRRRVRMTVRVEPLGSGSRLSVSTQTEERAPGGRLALRWQRIPSDGAVEREFMEQVRAHVHPKAL